MFSWMIIMQWQKETLTPSLQEQKGQAAGVAHFPLSAQYLLPNRMQIRNSHFSFKTFHSLPLGMLHSLHISPTLRTVTQRVVKHWALPLLLGLCIPRISCMDACGPSWLDIRYLPKPVYPYPQQLAGERKCNEKLKGQGKDRDRSVTSCCPGQNKPNSGKHV